MLNYTIMPKKTKKQKILSQKRREAFLLQQITKIDEPAQAVKIEREKNISAPDVVDIPSHQDKGIKEYFVSDFKKSIFIISLIIALEIVLYFGTINRYFN